MKLRLETQDNITILCVTEDVQNQHGAILRAGLTKLFKAGKKTIVLDLTGITQMDEGVTKEILAVQQLAPEIDCQLAIASPIDGLGNAPSRDEAVKQAGSVLFGLLATETKLSAQIKRLEKQKAGILENLNSLKASTDEIGKFLKENSRLRKQNRTLEMQVFRLLNKRVEIKPIAGVAERMSTLENTLASILAQDGIIAVKAK